MYHDINIKCQKCERWSDGTKPCCGNEFDTYSLHATRIWLEFSVFRPLLFYIFYIDMQKFPNNCKHMSSSCSSCIISILWWYDGGDFIILNCFEWRRLWLFHRKSYQCYDSSDDSSMIGGDRWAFKYIYSARKIGVMNRQNPWFDSLCLSNCFIYYFTVCLFMLSIAEVLFFLDIFWSGRGGKHPQPTMRIVWVM